MALALLFCGLPAVAFQDSAALQGRVTQQDLSLHNAIVRAQNGPGAQAARSRVDEAKAAILQARLSPNPLLVLQSEDLRPWAKGFDFANQTEDYGYLGQVFELDGKRGRRISLAGARAAQAQAQGDLALRQITVRVVTAYWNAVAQQQIIVLLREDMAAVDQTVQYLQNRVDAGATRGVDLLRLQIERDRLEISLATAERDAAQARLELFRQIGIAPYDARLTDKLEQIVVVPPISVETALAQRPDVIAARDAITAAQADLKLQHAQAVPDLDALAGYKRNSGADTIFTQIQIPLPFRNRNQGEIERARSSILTAQASLALLEAQVRAEIEQAEQGYAAQQRIVQQVLPRLRDDAQKNRTITAEAYRLGGVDLLRYIDAERTSFDTEVTALRTLANLQQFVANLQLAYGVQP